MGPVDYFIPASEMDTTSQVIAAHIDAYTEPGDLVLDPFCASPSVVFEASNAGRRAIAVSFDYLDTLRTRLAVTPVPHSELRTATTRLADSPKHATTLLELIEGLYRVPCPHCGQSAIAEYFIWQHGETAPRQACVHCAACGETAMAECFKADASGLEHVDPRGLHYWYVLDRVAKAEERGRKYAASLLDLYTPRNLYALANLGRKIDELFAEGITLDFLRLVLLRCLELGSKLNSPPDEPQSDEVSPARPPQRSVERNIWRLFTEVTAQFMAGPPRPAVVLADSVRELIAPPSGDRPVPTGQTALAFVGRLSTRDLVRQLQDRPVQLMCTQPPLIGRENWAMSYLWTGWLYGHEAAASLWPLVRHRSPDWSWYLQAIRTSLHVLRQALAPGARVTAIGPRREPSYHETMCLAAAANELYLEHAVFQAMAGARVPGPYAPLPGECQATWSLGAAPPVWPMSLEVLMAKVRQVAVETAQQVLCQRAEPAQFVYLHCHIWQVLAQKGLLQRVMSMDEVPAPRQWTGEQIQAALDEDASGLFVRLWEGEEEGVCFWWLAQPPDRVPLSERVERTACEILESVETTTVSDFLLALYRSYPGVLTPDREWVIACLRSYGEEVPGARWTLRSADRQTMRLHNRRENLRRLTRLGARLGFDLSPVGLGFDAQWNVEEHDIVAFALLDSAGLSRLLVYSPPDDATRLRRIAIVAEPRQDLIRLMLTRSVWLRKPLAEQGWRVIKEGDLRDWANQQEVALADLDSFVGLDLLAVEDRTQLPLI